MKKLMYVSAFMFSVLLIGRPAFANMEHAAEFSQALRQASTELQASNPDLSKKLDDFADKKDKWREEGERNISQKREDLSKVRQASEVLKGQNDGLSKDLDNIAGRWEKKLEKKEKKME